MMERPVGLLWGHARGVGIPQVWRSWPVAADDGITWTMAVESNEVTPAGLGGEAAFTMAYVTVRAIAGTTLRITPIVNDRPRTATTPLGVVTVLEPLVTVPQRATTDELVVQTFEVPLLQRLATAAGVQVAYPRGERLRLRFENVTPFGAGAFRLEQVEVEYTIMRRSAFAAITPDGGSA